MARNGIVRPGQAPSEPPRDPFFIIDQCIAILALALLFSLIGSITFAQERGTSEERRACTPDVFKHCGEFIPDPDRITVCLRHKVRELSPECRVVMTGSKRG